MFMLAATATYIIAFATLLVVASYALYASRRTSIQSAHAFLSAKDTQGPVSLAWCLFAAGMGSWTLFSFPEIGVLAGAWGIIGYTLSSCLAMLILACVGPRTRRLLCDGVTLSECILHRYGHIMQTYIAVISFLYQFLSLASEFTCVGQLTAILSPDAKPIVVILTVAVITNLYTLVGGMLASLATDVWQGVGVLSLVLLVCIVMVSSTTTPVNILSVAVFDTSGFETLVTLCIAVTSSNLFFSGFWQRVYAAADDATLRKACLYACGFCIPFTVALAVAGMVSSLKYPGEIYFFSLLLNMGTVWQVFVMMVIVSLASSASDSLQMGITAELVSNFPSLSLFHARVICVMLNVPAIFVALQNYSVLTLFLISDLLCTASVGPMLLALWDRSRAQAALIGCISGLLVIFVYGSIIRGSVYGGFEWFILPEGLYSFHSMITFILALVIPPVITITLSLLMGDSSD